MKLLDWGEDGLAKEHETAALRASFRQEVAVWHKLDHPNVTKVAFFNLNCIRYSSFFYDEMRRIHFVSKPQLDRLLDAVETTDIS